MVDETVSRHLMLVRELSTPGGVLSPASPHVSMKNPQWWRDGKPTPQRRALHRRLLDEEIAEAGAVDDERRAIVMAGPPGAGKGRIQADGLETESGRHLRIDADDFKKRLLREAIADGSLEAWLKPAKLRALEDDGERFFPLEMSALVHEESSYLAQQLRQRLIAEGRNILIDTVLSDPEKAVLLGEQLEAAGYRIAVVDVEVSQSLSSARIELRWRKAYEEALAGGDPLGGRWVPSEYARDVFAGADGRSRPEQAARALADQCGAVLRHRVYSTTNDQAARGEGPTLVVDRARAEPGAALEAVPIEPSSTPSTSPAGRSRGHRQSSKDQDRGR